MSCSSKRLYGFLLKGKISIWLPCIFSQYARQWLDYGQSFNIDVNVELLLAPIILLSTVIVNKEMCFVTLTTWRNQKQHIHVGQLHTWAYWDFKIFVLSKFSNSFHANQGKNKLLTLISYKNYILSECILSCVFKRKSMIHFPNNQTIEFEIDTILRTIKYIKHTALFEH